MSSDISSPKFEVQSETVFDVSVVTEADQSAITTTFHDENTGNSSGVGDSKATNLADRQAEIELAKYLSRPVLIKTHTWAQTDNYTTTTQWNPWYLFFNSPSIKNKINNYGLISCRLHLKFVINASPFYSGAMAFFYSPLLGWRGTTIIPDSGGGELIPYSQQPKVWIFPQTNQGGELVLPFFLHKNWLDVTSASELNNMGTITPGLFASLVSANGAVGQSVLINVYAWAEDIVLHAPTMKLAVQSDEYDYKPSQVASAVSNAASALSKVPVIGPYMTAASSVAAGFSKVASHFGYTNEPNINQVSYVKASAYPNFSSPEISVPLDKLTLDPKAETTVDPRTVGLDGKDELEISYIAKRESWLGNAILSSTDTVDTLTLVARVTPDLTYKANTLAPIQFTPISYVSQMFRHWRGDIVFRFKFICTVFHKGRVRISFDPIQDISTTIPDYTSIFNEVVDIGADNDVEITVPYMQATTFLRTLVQAFNYNFSGASLAPIPEANGLLTMRVVNPLSGPIAPVAIPVMIFVRAGDNFEVAYPAPATATGTTLTGYALQSSELVYAPSGKSLIAGQGAGKADPNRYLVHYGESICTFRTLLHRNMYQDTIEFPNPGTSSTFYSCSISSSRLPNYAGYDLDGFGKAAGTLVPGSNFNWNWTKMNVHQLVSLLFVGQRGTANWTYNIGSNLTRPFYNVTFRRRYGPINRASYRLQTSTTTATPGVLEGVDALNNLEENSGMSFTDQRLQPAISGSVPFYSPYNMQFVRPASSTLGFSADGSSSDNVQLQIVDVMSPLAVTRISVQRYFSYGPDYSFFCFINTPSLYYIFSPVGAAA